MSSSNLCRPQYLTLTRLVLLTPLLLLVISLVQSCTNLPDPAPFSCRTMASSSSSSGGQKLSSSGYNVEPMSKEEIEKVAEKLDPETRYVALESGTERPFSGKYWDKHEDGVYVSAVTDLPLFDSTTKFDSGTGWPSFTAPYDKDHIEEISDMSLGMKRTEVLDAKSKAHLGHVFDDGPGGKPRYCINSAALKFISREEWNKQSK